MWLNVAQLSLSFSHRTQDNPSMCPSHFLLLVSFCGSPESAIGLGLCLGLHFAGRIFFSLLLSLTKRLLCFRCCLEGTFMLHPLRIRYLQFTSQTLEAYT